MSGVVYAGVGVVVGIALVCCGFFYMKKRRRKQREATQAQTRTQDQQTFGTAKSRGAMHDKRPLSQSQADRSQPKTKDGGYGSGGDTAAKAAPTTYEPRAVKRGGGGASIGGEGREHLSDGYSKVQSQSRKVSDDSSGHTKPKYSTVKTASVTVEMSGAKSASPRAGKSGAAQAASGDMGSMIRDLHASGDQPETPPSEKRRDLAGFPATEAASAHFSSQTDADRRARLGSGGPKKLVPDYEDVSTKSAPPPSHHETVPKPYVKPSHARPEPFMATPPPPSHTPAEERVRLRSMSGAGATAPPKGRFTRTGTSRGSTQVTRTTTDVLPAATKTPTLRTAASMTTTDKDSTLLRLTIGQLRMYDDPRAKQLAAILGDEFGDRIIVGDAMATMEARRTGGPMPVTGARGPYGYGAGGASPATADMGTSAARASAVGAVATFAGAAGYTTGHGHGGGRPAFGGRGAPVDRSAHPKSKARFTDIPKAKEPYIEPFRIPSKIPQEYLDGYDSDESMYAPQFAKKSKRRLSVDDASMASSRDLKRRGLGKGRSKRRMIGAGPKPVGHMKEGKLTEKEFYEKYWIEAGKLGEGSFARVRKITRKRDRAPFALKVIKKAGKTKEDLKALEMEIKILSKLKQENVVRLTDWVDTSKRIYMVVEFCEGGDVFERILKVKTFTEADAANVVRQVLCGLEHIHTLYIVHRDLKPDNLMYATKADDSDVKIIDFGLAGDCSKKPLTTPCGTAHYAAPEVLSGKPYDTQADMWSMGVIVYMLLCGFPPFFDATGNTKRLYKLIKSGKYRFPSPYWDGVSEAAKDFIRGLLEKDVTLRMTALEALSHPWVCGAATTTDIAESFRSKIEESSRLMDSTVDGVPDE